MDDQDWLDERSDGCHVAPSCPSPMWHSERIDAKELRT